MTIPLTIITVSFNSEKTIRETLESLKVQNNKNFEHIIIDGNSKDGTIKIVNQYPFVTKIISEKDDGIYDGMNKGILNSQGKFIGFLNSDDILAHKNTLDNIINVIETEDTEIIYGNIQYFKNNKKEKTRKWITGNYPGTFVNGWHPPHPAFYAKKDLFIKSGGFDKKLTIAADFELMLRFFNTTNKKPIYIDKTFVLMREGGASHTNRIQGNKDVLNAFKKNNININKFRYLWLRLFSKFLTRYVVYPFKSLFTLDK